MNLTPRNKIKIEVSTAAMTNLVFLLLLFFIIMSVMVNKQIPVNLPAASNTKSVQDKVETTVVITEDNKYFVMPGEQLEQARAFDLVKEVIEREVSESGKPKLKISGHRNADYEAIFAVLALARENGWEPVLAYSK